MKTHVQIVAALHMAFGALSLLGAITIFLILMMAGGIVSFVGTHVTGGNDWGPADAHMVTGILGLIAVALGGLMALLSLPGLVGGWALFTGRSWGRPFVLVLGVLDLIQIPFGTALGIYTLWALFHEPPPPAA
jgi:hypothetical protein